MTDLIILILAILLLPLIIFRTEKNGLLFCKLTLAVIFLIIALEIITIIIKMNTGEFLFFNCLMIPVQAINIFSVSISYNIYKQKSANKDKKERKLEDTVV